MPTILSAFILRDKVNNGICPQSRIQDKKGKRKQTNGNNSADPVRGLGELEPALKWS
jgi:hypothetical protein